MAHKESETDSAPSGSDQVKAADLLKENAL
jgi:hypothetical protein